MFITWNFLFVTEISSYAVCFNFRWVAMCQHKQRLSAYQIICFPGLAFLTVLNAMHLPLCLRYVVLLVHK